MTEHPGEQEPEDQTERSAYLEHRKHLLEMGFGQIALADKSVLYIGSGSIALSIAFLDKITGSASAECTSILGSAWALLVTSLVFGLRDGAHEL